jgi:hypothetical protein
VEKRFEEKQTSNDPQSSDAGSTMTTPTSTTTQQQAPPQQQQQQQQQQQPTTVEREDASGQGNGLMTARAVRRQLLSLLQSDAAFRADVQRVVCAPLLSEIEQMRARHQQQLAALQARLAALSHADDHR